jgi:hypothetical protein
MKKEFGLRHAGSYNEYISCQASFVRDMRKYCGNIVTIKYVLPWDRDLFDIEEDGRMFTWSTDMIMPIGGLHEAIQSRRHSSDSSMG